ncbi:DMT family transporter [Novosphingobium aquiterrae]|jgi:drug/metabolite transporter (DMT)-like permease|uniref:DMT family transporter n=1 Tax=Novosphingobium aquiterrae TaxID=624388 RepID=A0ABV6PKT6_9SPHN
MDIAIPRSAGTDRMWQGVACGMAAGALWGLVFLAPELARAFTPLELAIGRYLAYGLLSAALIAPRWRAVALMLSASDWLSLVWLAVAGNTLYYVLLSSAVQLGGVTMTSLVIGFLPVLVTIIGSRERQAVPLRTLAPSLALCIAGAVCIGWQAIAKPITGSGGASLVGLLCAIGALLSWTAFAVSNNRCLARLDRVSVHDWSLLTGLMTGAQALMLVPVAMAFGMLRHDSSSWLLFGSISMAIALFASILGNAVWNRMSRLLPLTLSGQMILFETLFAMLYGLLWEQRLPTPLEIAAFTLLFMGVTSCLAVHRRPVGAMGAG